MLALLLMYPIFNRIRSFFIRGAKQKAVLRVDTEGVILPDDHGIMLQSLGTQWLCILRLASTDKNAYVRTKILIECYLVFFFFFFYIESLIEQFFFLFIYYCYLIIIFFIASYTSAFVLRKLFKLLNPFIVYHCHFHTDA